tara:strand:+ start:29 stop:208 length:180 start_codon:yes stop_codon:yes gene_type:complete
MEDNKAKEKISELRELNKTILKRFEIKIADNQKLRTENDKLKEELKKFEGVLGDKKENG